MQNKQEILGQYFTKIEIVKKLLDLLWKDHIMKNGI